MPGEDTSARKMQHIKIALQPDLSQFQSISTGLEKIQLNYNALPEIDLSEVSIETTFLGKKFSAPLYVSGMTGGCKPAEKINKDIARACEELGLGMGVGSQRAMLEDPSLTETYVVRDVAPSIFLAGNLGAVQLKNYSLERIEEMINSIKADALAIHLNPAQEAVQPEGTTNFSNILSLIDKASRKLSKPVYVKEVGNGISREVAEKLSKTNIQALDVGGAGGTSWTRIDYLRNKKNKFGPFAEFGIPTKDSLEQVREVFSKPIIATGGIRTGLDVVKCLSLGASLCGMAFPVLKAQDKAGFEGVKEFLEKTMTEIKIGLFLVGAKNISELRKLKPINY